ncbi:hypothetical protein BGZ76_001850 [Entomortierella beljakovae]|nr:hypothetical protein BGZ76_001850 [Entomortierella beljakovae]
MLSKEAQIILAIIALMHIKSLPGVYTLRSIRYFVKSKGMTEPSIGLLETSKIHSRVWFDDLDLNIHLNNSSYNKMMDFARIDMCTRLFPGWKHTRDFDVCLAQTVLFFKAEVPRFSKYTITSRVFTWDDKWIWAQHRFSIKRKSRPIRKTLEVMGGALEAGEQSQSNETNKGDDEEGEEEEEEDDIDPIEDRTGSISQTMKDHSTNPNFGSHPNGLSDEIPDKLCCIAYSRMVAKLPKGKTIPPHELFTSSGHREAYPGEWEQYRLLGLSLIEGMMKIGDTTAYAPPPSGRRLVNPTKAKF